MLGNSILITATYAIWQEYIDNYTYMHTYTCRYIQYVLTVNLGEIYKPNCCTLIIYWEKFWQTTSSCSISQLTNTAWEAVVSLPVMPTVHNGFHKVACSRPQVAARQHTLDVNGDNKNNWATASKDQFRFAINHNPHAIQTIRLTANSSPQSVDSLALSALMRSTYIPHTLHMLSTAHTIYFAC